MGRSLLNVDTTSPLQQNEKSSVMSKKSCLTSPWITKQKWKHPKPVPLWKRITNCPTVKSSPSVMSVSEPLRPCSNPPTLAWKPLVSMRQPTTQSCTVIWTSEKTCTPTLSCLVVRLCSPVLLIVCRRRSPNLPHPPWRSRSSHHQSVNILSGSPKLNMTNAVQQSSTENASRILTDVKCEL